MPREPSIAPPIESPGYRESAPIPTLREGIACAWTYRARAAGNASTLVIPDGCVDLIWKDDELFVAGPDRIATLTQVEPGQALTAVRFAAATAMGFLGMPLDEITGLRVPLRDLWGRQRCTRLFDALDTAATAPRLIRLQQALVDAGPLAPQADMAWLFASLAVGTAPPLPALARQLGLSERTLRRRCHHAFGYGPKRLERILRLQRFLAQPSRTGNLLARALAAGYQDASQLVRESRALTGLAPARLIAERQD